MVAVTSLCLAFGWYVNSNWPIEIVRELTLVPGSQPDDVLGPIFLTEVAREVSDRLPVASIDELRRFLSIEQSTKPGVYLIRASGPRKHRSKLIVIVETVSENYEVFRKRVDTGEINLRPRERAFELK